MIVVDAGCATHGKMSMLDESLRPLIRRFHPDVYFGFDIYPGMLDGETEIDGTKCIFSRRAVWTSEGFMAVGENGNCTHLDPRGVDEDMVPTFDFGAFLSLLPDGPIVKLDIEGSEYPVLWDLHERGIDRRIELLLVEWHNGRWANGFQRERPPLRCQVLDWDIPHASGVVTGARKDH